MNWDGLLDQFCEEQQCSNRQIMAASSNPVSRREAAVMERRQRDASKAMNAVRQAIDEDPTRSREDARKRACQFIIGSVIIGIILQSLISVFIRRAIEWFLDKYYNKETPNGAVSVSSE